MKSLNRILTDEDRRELEGLIYSMWEVCKSMMARKIPDANVQQAFVLDTVLRSGKSRGRILSAGCFEDTAFDYLLKTNHDIVGTDPDYDGKDLRAYLKSTNELYDIVFATSVLEHVPDDEGFLADVCTLLKRGGLGILTMDFQDEYQAGNPVPYTDVRFYTKFDLEVRLRNVIKQYDCDLVGEPDWTGKDRFTYQGHNYSFATFVFTKAL